MPIIVFTSRFIFAILSYPGLLQALYGIYWLSAHLQIVWRWHLLLFILVHNECVVYKIPLHMSWLYAGTISHLKLWKRKKKVSVMWQKLETQSVRFFMNWRMEDYLQALDEIIIQLLHSSSHSTLLTLISSCFQHSATLNQISTMNE